MNPTTHRTGRTGFEPDQIAAPAQNPTPLQTTASTPPPAPAGHVTPPRRPGRVRRRHPRGRPTVVRGPARPPGSPARRGTDGEHTIRLPHDPTNTAFGFASDIWDMATASVNGYLAVEPTDRAYRWLEDTSNTTPVNPTACHRTTTPATTAAVGQRQWRQRRRRWRRRWRGRWRWRRSGTGVVGRPGRRAARMARKPDAGSSGRNHTVINIDGGRSS